MSGLKRSNTLSNLKRSNTMQTLKRAGTGAWKWINAEDVKVSENRPIGHSYFQRSNTYKKLQENGNTPYQLNQRPTYNQGYEPYANTNNYPMNPSPMNTSQVNNSYSVNMDNSYASGSQYESNKSSSNSYVTDIKRPEPAAEKDMGKDKKSKVQRVPTVLYDPKVRKQLEELKQYTPYFMYIITFVQVLLMAISLIVNYKYEHKIITSPSTNFMLGPNSSALIHLGARFVPCMKDLGEEDQIFNVTICADGIKGSIPPGNYKDPLGKPITDNLCSLSDLCGMGGFKNGEEPNQWYRFILPIFLHAGIIHLIVNLSFQIRTGVQMERDFGTWRMIIIYMLSGIFGFAFGANFSLTAPSVGCSGSLYGLLACLLLDLIQNWKLIIKPWQELIKMSTIILFSLGIGLLPFVDNFAHVGGFIIGILTGLIFMPTIIFSKWDLRRKRILMILSIIFLIVAFVWVFKQFYDVTSECKWCKYLNCLPVNGWCDDPKVTSTSN